MIYGPVIPSLDGTPYTAAEVWCLVEVLERSDKNQGVHGDCESVEKMVKDLHLHSKNDFENVSHASWWRRLHYLSWDVPCSGD